MAVKDMLRAHLLTVTTMKQKLFFNIMVVIGTDVENVFLMKEIIIINNHNQTREDRFNATVERTKKLQAAGYRVIDVWSCEVGKINVKLPKTQMQSYPHAILYKLFITK